MPNGDLTELLIPQLRPDALVLSCRELGSAGEPREQEQSGYRQVVQNSVQRRLAAILAADVVGYTRLMGTNEVGTLNALKAHQTEFIDGRITHHHGRIVKLTGDGLLAEFSSIVNAVQCAVEIQTGMQDRNRTVPDDRQIIFRIGINLGDVIIEGDDIYGEGVNLAARLESIADAGGVAVSSLVREHIGRKLDLQFEDAGEYTLKNIELPVRVFKVSAPKKNDQASPTVAANATRSSARPSIAVLPFTNMSGDPEQEYFSDGITEDIITDLSQISSLFVVGRNSSFTYKGKSVRLEQAAKELGVRYLLEGSVRKAGQRVRITGQLIDGATGGHLWASRYDRDLTDIFAVQDEISHTIVSQLKLHLLPDEREAINHKPTQNVEAYTTYLKARQLFLKRTFRELQEARQFCEAAIKLDPDYARAYAGLAECDVYLANWYGAEIAANDILATADKALALDSALPEANAVRGFALANMDHRDEARMAFERALSLGPECYEANYYFARFSFSGGDLENAARFYVRALEIDPEDYKSPCLLQGVFDHLGQPENANRYGHLGIKRIENAYGSLPDTIDPLALGASVLAGLGEREKAREWLARALALNDAISDSWYNIACTYALLGDLEKALDLLEQWQPRTGSDQRRWLAEDRDFDSIRKHPRFMKLMQQLQVT
jgi:adenylate cyclase